MAGTHLEVMPAFDDWLGSRWIALPQMHPEPPPSRVDRGALPLRNTFTTAARDLRLSSVARQRGEYAEALDHCARRGNGLTVGEAASLLDTTVAAIRLRLHRAARALRYTLDGDDHGSIALAASNTHEAIDFELGVDTSS